MSGDAWVNTDAGFLGGPDEIGSARDRVLKIQAKLHLWAKSDPDRRFGDLFVRHEAPCVRAGVGGPCRWAVAAAWLKLRTA